MHRTRSRRGKWISVNTGGVIDCDDDHRWILYKGTVKAFVPNSYSSSSSSSSSTSTTSRKKKCMGKGTADSNRIEYRFREIFVPPSSCTSRVDPDTDSTTTTIALL